MQRYHICFQPSRCPVGEALWLKASSLMSVNLLLEVARPRPLWDNRTANMLSNSLVLKQLAYSWQVEEAQKALLQTSAFVPPQGAKTP